MIKFARWLTVDPLWPFESAYQYSGHRATYETDTSGMGVDACLDALVACQNLVDRGKNICTRRVMDEFADDYLRCAGSWPCINIAYAKMMAGLAACYAKYDPGYLVCWLSYLQCVQKRSPIPVPVPIPSVDWNKFWRDFKYGWDTGCKSNPQMQGIAVVGAAILVIGGLWVLAS